ncbi:MAG: hypothetical protein LBR11_07165 [Deltaproteobacteria bacterium]|jgi:glutamate-1-semialdehyde 2,1-aminomutase|nr:hypothetical protein [Deltaproteobacteria bacterium]
MSKSELLFEKTLKLIPGGLNNPIRSVKVVKAPPKFVARAKGARLWDVDGRD